MCSGDGPDEASIRRCEREQLRREAKGRRGLGEDGASDGQGLTGWNGVLVGF